MIGYLPRSLTVGGRKLTAADQAKLLAVADGDYNAVLTAAGANNDTLGDVVYQNILGLDVTLPTYTQIASRLIKITKTPRDKSTRVFLQKDEVAAEDLEAFTMLVPRFHHGRGVWFPDPLERCSDLRDRHLL